MLSLSSSLYCSRLDLLSLRVIIIVVVIMPPKDPPATIPPPFRHRSATVLPSFGGGGDWVPRGATHDYCRWGMEGKRVYRWTWGLNAGGNGCVDGLSARIFIIMNPPGIGNKSGALQITYA